VASTRPEPRGAMELTKEVESFRAQHVRQRKINWTFNLILIGAGILLSIAVIVAGIYDEGKIAAVLGALTAAAIAAQNAIAAGEKAEFYRVVCAEAENLLDELRYLVDTNREFETTVRTFEALRKHAATALPRGQGMEAVKRMGEDLARAKEHRT
jgi:hypothetical protein